MHWAEPAHATRFLELIRGEATSDETVRRTEELARRLGKDPTVCRQDIPGFIVNRIGYAMYREALHLVELGVADIETIDRSVRNTLGLWAASCGPFRWIDLTGGPALYARSMERVIPTLRNDAALPALLAALVRAGCTRHRERPWLLRVHAGRNSRLGGTPTTPRLVGERLAGCRVSVGASPGACRLTRILRRRNPLSTLRTLEKGGSVCDSVVSKRSCVTATRS